LVQTAVMLLRTDPKRAVGVYDLYSDHSSGWSSTF
jgi:hypothetical protein